MRKILFATVTMGCLAVSAAENKVVYYHDFNFLADDVAAFRPGTCCWEWETGSLKGLRFAPKAEDVAHRDGFKIETPPVGKWTLTFVVQNRAKEPSPFEVVLTYADGRVEAHPFVAERPWFVMKSLFSSHDGRLVRWNLRGKPGCDFVLDYFRIEQGVHRPYRLGDPAEWLAKLPPVKDEPLPADFGEPLGGKTPLAVDLEKEDLLFKYKPANADLVFGLGEKQVKRLSFRLCDEKFGWPDRKTLVVLTNEYWTISPARMQYFPRVYSRPRVADRYQKGEMELLLANLDRFPKVTDKVYDLRLTRNGRGENELYVEGNLALVFTNAPVLSVAGTPAFRMKRAPRPAPSLVQPLDFRSWPQGFPLWNVRENRGGCWLGVLYYCCRSCFEAMPSSCLFSVPNRPYTKARALCRVATDVPTDFEPVVVARLTSYSKVSWGDAGGRNAYACAKAEVRLPRPGSDDPLAKGVVKKGENLYEVTFDLPVGEMQDLLYRPDPLSKNTMIDQLDFEFTGVLWKHDCCYVDRSSVPDTEAQSSVVVLSGELESAPCDFDVVPLHPFSCYLPDETPGGTYTIRPYRPGDYEIAYTVTDEEGKVVDRGSVRSAQFGELRPRPNGGGCISPKCTSGVIRFEKAKTLGAYKVRYDFREGGKTLWTHDASYVVLPEDDRIAGYDSPYFDWIWTGVHGTCHSLEATFDLFKRFGVHGALLDRYTKFCETNDVCRALKLYQPQFRYEVVGKKPGESEEDRLKRQVAFNRDLIAKFPHTKRAMVFHESGGGAFPMELVGKKTELTDDDRKRDADVAERATFAAKAWRMADPSVKILLGNSVEGFGLISAAFRGGLDRSLVDFLGEETVGMSAPPEQDSARVPWIQREIARLHGYEGVKSDCPFEWKCRSSRNFADPEYTGTAFHIRDCLIAHTLDYKLILCGTATGGSADGYAQSVWSGSKNGRWPLAYPDRGTLANAVLTSVMDTAKFRRLLPTGSLTVYAPEFAVKDHFVYGLWTARGTVDVTLDLGENTDYETVSIVGKRTKHTASTLNSQPSTLNTLAVADEPLYLLTKKPLKGLSSARQRRYPHEEMSFAKRAVAVPLASAEEVRLTAADPRQIINVMFRDAPFAAKTADDPVKGACVELTDLSGAKKTPKVMMNCTRMAFPNAQPVAGTFDSIGVWVEGNSGWGKIWFELTDAEGEVWMTSGSGGIGSCSYDWPGLLTVNFDGWHFLKFPLTEASPIRVPSCGENEEQLTCDACGNGRIDFPVKVTGLGVGNCPWAIDLLEMCPTQPTLRFKDVTLLGK